jgi:MerR family transcriptional regulator, light-induced transcriptional regulator
MAAAKEQIVSWKASPTTLAPIDISATLQTGQQVPHLDRLALTIETEIIPRLVLARRAARETGRASMGEATGPSPSAVAELAGLVLTRDADVARSFVEDMHQRGAPVEALYLDLLAPAARRLGELWNADVCDFADVTVALGRLQQVLHELSPVFHAEAEPRQHGRRVLLVPVPGEQHSFGLHMVAEFFRRSSWDVWTEPRITSGADLVQLVRKEWFAVVGLSLGCDTRVDALATGIRALRRASRNRAIGVLVGGPLFVEHPELVARVGADATAVDGGQAPLQAQNVLALLACRR